jgi:hypothetical protein
VSHEAVLAIASTLSVKPSRAPAPNDGSALGKDHPRLDRRQML